MSVTNPALFSQVHPSGEVSCPLFSPHFLKANFCTSCSKLINKHSAEAIPDNQCLLKVSFVAKNHNTRYMRNCYLPGLGIFTERRKDSKLYLIGLRWYGCSISRRFQDSNECGIFTWSKSDSCLEHCQGFGNIWTQICGMSLLWSWNCMNDLTVVYISGAFGSLTHMQGIYIFSGYGVRVQNQCSLITLWWNPSL